MKLVYQWNIGTQIMDSALHQIELALDDPETVFGSEEEQLIKIKMPLKKQKLTKQKKKGDAGKATEIQMTIKQSLALLKAIINESIHQ